MLQTEQHLFHRHAALAEDTGCIEQDDASQEPQDQMPIVGRFRLHLAGLGGQQVLQRAEMMFNPTSSPPGPDQTWCRDECLPAEQVEALVSRFIDNDERDPPIGGAGCGESGIPDPWYLGALTPGPVGQGPEVLARHPAPIKQVEDVGALPLHQQQALQVAGYMRHHLRVPEPTIGHYQGRGQPQTQLLQGGPGPVQHDLQPRQLVAAGPSGPHRVRPAHHKVHRDDQLPVPDHHHQEQAIDPQSDPMFLAAIPGAYQAQLLTRLLEDTVIAHPSPLSATAGRGALVLHMMPQGC
jgi:hypothetical protein